MACRGAGRVIGSPHRRVINRVSPAPLGRYGRWAGCADAVLDRVEMRPANRATAGARPRPCSPACVAGQLRCGGTARAGSAALAPSRRRRYSGSLARYRQPRDRTCVRPGSFQGRTTRVGQESTCRRLSHLPAGIQRPGRFAVGGGNGAMVRPVERQIPNRLRIRANAALERTALVRLARRPRRDRRRGQRL